MEGRCATAVTEIDGHLPDPTGCPTLPAVTFDYAPAKLASGVATYTAIGAPGTAGVLSYATSTALIDINRDGLPDLVQAWPTNHHQKGYKVEYNECKNGDFVVDAGAVPFPQLPDPQLACTSGDAIRSARQHQAWINRGPGIGGLRLDYHCLDAGGVEADKGFEQKTLTSYQVTTPKGLESRAPSLFTQYGAAAIGEWGNGSILWSLAGYHAFGFATAVEVPPPGTPTEPGEYDPETFLKFCPEFATNPLQPALRWVKTGSSFWAKDATGRDAPERRYHNIVDIDGDGYGDLLTEPSNPEEAGDFKRAAVRFTRKISGLETADGTRGPALYPFITSDSAAVTVTNAWAEYSTYADINGDGILDLITARPWRHGGVPEVRLGDGRGGFGCDPGNDIACQVEGNGAWLGRAFQLFTPEKIAPFPLPPDAYNPWPLTSDFPYVAGPAHFFHDVTGVTS